MKASLLSRRTLSLAVTTLVLLALFAWVALRTGPFARIPVTVTRVELTAISPQAFGIGTVEARRLYRVAPVSPGRLQSLDVDVGDPVRKGQVLGEMDPVDLDERIRAQNAALTAAQVLLGRAKATRDHSKEEADRYERLLDAGSTSSEILATRRQALSESESLFAAALADLARSQANLDALQVQKSSLRLVAPAAGLIVSRRADPGTTLAAGQYVVEIADPDSLWIDTRFDQRGARDLAAGQSASVTLRSGGSERFAGRLERIERLADVITEELLAKITLDSLSGFSPALGELAEVTVNLPTLPPSPVIPNAALRTLNGSRGVWILVDGRPRFTPVTVGRSDLSGRVQITAGLSEGENVIVYSNEALSGHRRIRVVDAIPGVGR